MNRTLNSKFVIGYIVFAILSLITVATVSNKLFYKNLIKEEVDSMYLEANTIVNAYASSYFSSKSTMDETSLELKRLDTMMDRQIWIIDTTGAIVLDTRKQTSKTSEIPEVIEEFDPTANGGKYYQQGDFYGYFDEEMITVMSPITSHYSIRGYVLIHEPVDNIIPRKDSYLIITFIMVFMVFAYSMVFLIIFRMWVLRPLRKITIAAGEYAGGNLKYELNVQSDDEMGNLANAMSYMAKELNETEEYQRKFISNISHDFRSPLTSIKGYLEAMLDGTIPQELQGKYLNIVINETERLTKLTSSLLTLNKMDSKEARLEITRFDINQMIKQVILTFEGTCSSKNIKFNLIFDEKENYVLADYSKIQQVLYNLIDNAIKFSNTDSFIHITTTEKGDKVFISVKDTGIGIPKESISKIWDRFYKSDLSRGKDKKGTGLGLSIVKEILNTHKENINVISTEGVGTEFIFTLSKAKDNI